MCIGLSINHKDCVRLIKQTVIPARNEKVLAVRCHQRNSLISGDFEPMYNVGRNSVYVNRARVTSNSIGIFLITVPNTNSFDQIFESRKVIGVLHPKCNVVENLPSEFREKEISKDSLTLGKSSSIEQQSELKNVLNE